MKSAQKTCPISTAALHPDHLPKEENAAERWMDLVFGAMLSCCSCSVLRVRSSESGTAAVFISSPPITTFSHEK